MSPSCACSGRRRTPSGSGYAPRCGERGSFRRLNQSSNTISDATSVIIPMKMSPFVISVLHAAGHPASPATPTSQRPRQAPTKTTAPAAGTGPGRKRRQRGSRARAVSLTAPCVVDHSIVPSSFAHYSNVRPAAHRHDFTRFRAIPGVVGRGFFSQIAGGNVAFAAIAERT